MKKALLALTLALGVPFAMAQTSPGGPAHAHNFKTHILKRAELDKLLADPSKIVIIDLRRPDEIQTIGSLPVYLSIQAADLQKDLGFIPKDRAVITVSNHAGRAGIAADSLTDAGFKVAGAVGVEYYAQEGGKISKITPPSPKAAK